MLHGRSQIYSVFDDHEGTYSYYSAADTGPATNTLRGPNPRLGAPPEDAAVRVPFAARYVGTGNQAIGRVAEMGVNWSSVIKWGILGFAIYGGIQLYRGRR